MTQGIAPAIHDYAARQRVAHDASARTLVIAMAVTVDRIGVSEVTVDFNTFFFEPPNFTYGAVAATPLSLEALPLATAIVRAWDRTARGYYRGANVGFHLWRPPGAPADPAQVAFHLHFEGVATPTLYRLEG
jgi:hypothetical protein